MRLFLAVWLLAFAVQSTDLLAAVAPDSCVEGTADSAADPCPDNCASCVCCARLPVFVPQTFAVVATDLVCELKADAPTNSPTNAEPRGILHVPKAH